MFQVPGVNFCILQFLLLFWFCRNDSYFLLDMFDSESFSLPFISLVIFIPAWGNDPIWLIFFKWFEPPTRKLRSNMLLESFWILGPRLQATTIRNKDGIRSHQNTHLYILSYDTLPCIYLESNDLYLKINPPKQGLVPSKGWSWGDQVFYWQVNLSIGSASCSLCHSRNPHRTKWP